MSDEGKLPDFIICGFQKAGTTTIMEVLNQSSNIELTPNITKSYVYGDEAHFFDLHWEKGIEWYKKIFNNNGKLQGDKTPDYIIEKGFIKKMYSVVPNAKLIVVMRNPVTRAYSAYNHYNTYYNEGHKEVADWGWVAGESFLDNVKSFEKNPLISNGIYVDQLKNLFEFYPKDKVHIVVGEQMYKNGQEVFRGIFKFLRSEYQVLPFNVAHNKKEYKEQMDDESRKLLTEFYKPHNEILFKLLGYEIKEWS